MERYTCYSGGASGSDLIFELESLKKGYKVVAYSFEGHNTKSNNRYILTDKELQEGFEHIKITNKRLNRNLNNISPYVKKLIARDWFQVKNSDSIFAVGNLDGEDNVGGGTGYAVSCVIDNKKPVYLFEQNDNMWFYFDYQTNKFEAQWGIPKLTHNFAGIGTRDINDNGIEAIKKLFKE